MQHALSERAWPLSDKTCLKETLLIWKRCGVAHESAGPEAKLLIVIVCFMPP